MRDTWLSNRIFKSFDDIVDHGIVTSTAFYWSVLTPSHEPVAIKSMG
jgi:hypothetical protein